jgi:hypothetical protein
MQPYPQRMKTKMIGSGITRYANLRKKIVIGALYQIKTAQTTPRHALQTLRSERPATAWRWPLQTQPHRPFVLHNDTSAFPLPAPQTGRRTNGDRLAMRPVPSRAPGRGSQRNRNFIRSTTDGRWSSILPVVDSRGAHASMSVVACWSAPEQVALPSAEIIELSVLDSAPTSNDET